MKEVIVNMDQKSQIKPHNLRKFQQVLFTKAKPIQELRLHSCQRIDEKLKRTLAKIASFDSIPGRLIIHLW